MNIIAKLPKNHIIIYKKYINDMQPGILRNGSYLCDLIYKTRIICINDLTNVYKSQNIMHKQYHLIEYKFKFSGIEQNGAGQPITYDRFEIINHIDDFHLTNKETLFIDNENRYSKILTIENNDTIKTPPNYTTFDMFDYEHSKTVQIIKWYLFEDLTVNMWIVQQHPIKSPCIKKSHAIRYSSTGELGVGFAVWSSIGEGVIEERFNIYGFDSELLKEIDRFSWMRRRSAIIRPDELIQMAYYNSVNIVKQCFHPLLI
jgi:hypothetical protein